MSHLYHADTDLGIKAGWIALFLKVRELDVKFQKENRKFALIIDNCPAHQTIADLSNFKLVFLPPNMTSVPQPMDPGVIKCVKAFYRRRLVNFVIKRLEQGQDLPKISILCALLNGTT